MTKKKLKNQFTRKIYLHKLFDSVDLTIDFLMYAYIHNFNKELCAEIFAFFDKNIPYEASFYQHRVIIRLYKALFDNDTEKVDFYTRLLEEDNFTFCLQNVPVTKKDSSHAH
ncbi:hypothetical protein [Lactobacillus helveticus]|uniref:hypothetical protein n=1 Tax=Lactobacillus helveticus TaxID=1587 RepID=UPI0019DF1916|nr:hypothetical protein [Lactobacillus helveticus]GFP02235.1 hypothetical protein LHEY10_01640 [Lactobacillus helveticus]